MTITVILKGMCVYVCVTRFNLLNDNGRVEIAPHAFLVLTLELKETPPPPCPLIGHNPGLLLVCSLDTTP
jgi:hypothetical protein